MSAPAKEIIVLGGPNGAGKTTAAKELLPQALPVREFINADDIALGLSPHNVEGAAVAAARAMIGRMNSLLVQKSSFAFETTCSGRGHLAFLKRAKTEGWRISLLFLWLPSPQAALERVARRVREGGHNIPADIVIRRYWKGISALRESYLPMADVAAVYDNSDKGRRLIVERQPGQRLRVHDEETWKQIESVTR
jgi:predicted ABC-type ATPase